MNNDAKVVQTGQGWFVESSQGRVGPMDSQSEASTYLSLMRIAQAAGSEVACTEKECYS